MPYEFLDQLAIADVQFRAWGKDLSEVFRAAAEATTHVMVRNPDAIEPRERVEVAMKNEELDMLLFDFLQELIYLKDAERLLLRVVKAELSGDDQSFNLHAILTGETLDATRHEQGADVKAVTLHQYRLEQTAHGWQAFVILDI